MSYGRKVYRRKTYGIRKTIGYFRKADGKFRCRDCAGSDGVNTEDEEFHQALSKTGEGARALTGVGIKMFKKGLSGLGKQLSKLDDTDKIAIEGKGEQN